MESKLKMTIKTIIGFVVALGVPGAALAHQGSAEDQMACTPDVFRLCATQVPNEDAIVACLERNKPSLSPGCKRVFSQPEPGQHNGQGDDDDN